MCGNNWQTDLEVACTNLSVGSENQCFAGSFELTQYFHSNWVTIHLVERQNLYLDTDKITDYFLGQASDINFFQMLRMRNKLHTTTKLNVLPISLQLKVTETEYNFLCKEKMGGIYAGFEEKWCLK